MCEYIVDDETGKLHFYAFCDLMAQYRKTTEEVEAELLRAFMVFDKNGDSTIDAQELREVHAYQIFVKYDRS